MKNLVITCSDKKYGDFLVKHWFRSLKENNDMKKTDVLVIDYGLSNEQRKILDKNKVIRYVGVKDGFPNTIKFRDIENFLTAADKKYDQIMTCDGGDIIFQSDINHLFKKDKNTYRCVVEKGNALFETVFEDLYFDKKTIKEIHRYSKGVPVINCGMVVASYDLFMDLCRKFNNMKPKKTFGPDQIVVNYLVRKHGFKQLEDKYNYVVAIHGNENFKIKNNKFFLNSGEIIPIVHNAGGKDIVRPVKNFGYGKGRNQLKNFTHFFIDWIITNADRIKKYSAKNSK